MTREEMFQIGCELVRAYSPVVETKVEITIVEPAKIKENVFSPRQLQFSRDWSCSYCPFYRESPFFHSCSVKSRL